MHFLYITLPDNNTNVLQLNYNTCTSIFYVQCAFIWLRLIKNLHEFAAILLSAYAQEAFENGRIEKIECANGAERDVFEFESKMCALVRQNGPTSGHQWESTVAIPIPNYPQSVRRLPV